MILHVSDVHCETGRLKSVLARVSYDAVVATGDFECVDAAEALLRANGPVAAVTGNMDHAGVRRVLADAGVLLDGRVATLAGLRVAGVGGLTPSEDAARVSRLGAGSVDILATHHPPKGVLDEPTPGIHIGLVEVRRLVEALRPRAHLFGHAHEARGCLRQGGTTYVNPGPLMHGNYAILRVSGDAVDCELP